MIRTLVLLALFFVGASAFAQEPALPCCNCDSAARPANVTCLSTDQLDRRVIHIEPLRATGLDKDLKLAGTLIIDLKIGVDGKVECAHAIEGNPIAVSAAMSALPKWTFKPSTKSGIPRSSCGRLKIRFRLSSNGSSTKLLR